MRFAVTGATGQVGHWILADLLEAGHAVAALGRRPSLHRVAGHVFYDLAGSPPDLRGCDVLVHAAFSHVPGKYRGGEGDDPDRFQALNRDGSIRLFQAAAEAGLSRIVFVSSRAVYGNYPPGTRLSEDLPPRPDTLYGAIKRDVEQSLLEMSDRGAAVAILRATGVFGAPVPGQRHKWQDLLDAFGRGEAVAPRAATEVHAGDLAAAVRLVAECDAAMLGQGIFNVSGLLLDRRDLLTQYSEITGLAGHLPERGDREAVNVMSTDRLRSLGWCPAGFEAVREVLRLLAAR